MKKIIVMFALMCGFSTTFAQVPITRAFVNALKQYNPKFTSLLEKGEPFDSKLLRDCFVVASPALTAAMMPPTIETTLPATTQVALRHRISANLREQFMPSKNTLPVVAAPKFKISPQTAIIPPFQKMNGYVEKELSAFEMLPNKDGIRLFEYFRDLIATIYPTNSYYYTTSSNWNSLQHVQRASALAGFNLLESSIQYAFQFARKSVPVIVLGRGEPSTATEDALILDVKTGKLISYKKSMEPVWDRILETFPEKSEVVFYNPNLGVDKVSVDQLGDFYLSHTIVVSNGDGTGVLVDIVKDSKDSGVRTRALESALKYNYKFYLQPLGEPIALTKGVTKKLGVRSVYPHYVLYVAPRERGQLYKIEDVENPSSEVTPQ